MLLFFQILWLPVISVSLSINIIERERRSLLICCLSHPSHGSVYPERVFWQHGSLDPDAVWVMSGDGRGMGILDWAYVPEGKGDFGIFHLHRFEWHIF